MKLFDWRPRIKVSVLGQIGPIGPKYDFEKVHWGLWPKQPCYICSLWWHKKIDQKDLLRRSSRDPPQKLIRPNIGFWALKFSNFFSTVN